MGIHIGWCDDDQTIILWRFETRWTLADLQTTLAENQATLHAADQRIDFILDITEGGLAPLKFTWFMRNYREDPHPLEGIKIVIGADEYLRFFWRKIAGFATEHWQIQFADSLADAQAIIQQDRSLVTAR